MTSKIRESICLFRLSALPSNAPTFFISKEELIGLRWWEVKCSDGWRSRLPRKDILHWLVELTRYLRDWAHQHAIPWPNNVKILSNLISNHKMLMLRTNQQKKNYTRHAENWEGMLSTAPGRFAGFREQLTIRRQYWTAICRSRHRSRAEQSSDESNINLPVFISK